jgi:hypothetical protein
LISPADRWFLFDSMKAASLERHCMP